MYGYVVVNKPEMKFKEFDEYRSYYCGLCHALKSAYGMKGQLSLTYDFTFLGMLLSGLYEPKEERKMCRCMVHPFNNQNVVSNECLDYLADMSVLLTWYKCIDDWQDDKKLSRKLYSDVILGNVEKIKEKYPDKADVISICIKNISAAEERKEKNIDVVAGYFGKALSEIVAMREDIWEDSLRIIGNNLGKFIYILDAYDDIDDDLKKDSYNPLIDRADSENFEEEVKMILQMCAAPCAAEFEKLPIINNVSILRNILYSGIWTRYENIREKRKKNDGSL